MGQVSSFLRSSVCAGSAGISTSEVPGYPVAIGSLAELHELGVLDVAGDDNRAVIGPIPALEEQTAVLVLLGHVLDVFKEADRGVLVGVGRVSRVLKGFKQDQEGRGGRLVVLSQNGASFLLERGLVVSQVLEAVGLELDGLGQGRGGYRHVVARPVVGREGVRVSA